MAAILLQAIGGALPVEVARFPAPEAIQGVTAGGHFVYAIDNSAIGKYDPATGKRVARWKGDPRRFKHLNSCVLVERNLVCAGSNYPDVPMASSVETFDAETLRHRAMAVLDELTRHRQHDADLVYEAYATDIGGE